MFAKKERMVQHVLHRFRSVLVEDSCQDVRGLVEVKKNACKRAGKQAKAVRPTEGSLSKRRDNKLAAYLSLT